MDKDKVISKDNNFSRKIMLIIISNKNTITQVKEGKIKIIIIEIILIRDNNNIKITKIIKEIILIRDSNNTKITKIIMVIINHFRIKTKISRNNL